jgi:hypothetical protein
MNLQLITKLSAYILSLLKIINTKLPFFVQIHEKTVSEGMGGTLIKHILDAEQSPIALHDLKIKLSSNLHGYLIEQGYPTHKKNKMMQMEMKTTSHTTVKIQIYPKTILIDIGCSNDPFTCLPAGAVKLSLLISNILHFLCVQSSHKAKIDSIDKWILTHYHKNRDGKITYSSDGFHMLLEDVLGRVTRAYSKTFHDGSTFVRIEEIITEKILLTNMLEIMKKPSMRVVS